jgi:hypothetical protein
MVSGKDFDKDLSQVEQACFSDVEKNEELFCICLSLLVSKYKKYSYTEIKAMFPSIVDEIRDSPLIPSFV